MDEEIRARGGRAGRQTDGPLMARVGRHMSFAVVEKEKDSLFPSTVDHL